MQALSAVRRFIEDERGVTAIEYGLIAAVIAVAVATALGDVQTALTGLFNQIAGDLNAV